MSVNVPAVSDGIKAPGRRLWLVVATVAVVTVVLVSVFAVQQARPRPSGASIASISYSPNPALPNEYLTIEVISEYESGIGSPPVRLAFQTTFACNATSEVHNVGGTDWDGGNRHTKKIGPFSDGTGLWIVAIALGEGGDFAVNSSLLINVGNVASGGPSGLDISSVNHTPTNPTVVDTVVVNATVTSSSTLRDVELLLAYVDRLWGSGADLEIDSWGMTKISSTQFIAEIDNPYFDYSSAREIDYLFRIAAIDESNNTAMSDVQMFTWT